jgi:hypothetical protein
MFLEIIDDAAEDIVSIFNWYESKRSGLGKDFELCLDEIFQELPEILKFTRNGIAKSDVP